MPKSIYRLVDKWLKDYLLSAPIYQLVYKWLESYFISASIYLLGKKDGNPLFKKATLELLFYLFLNKRIIENAELGNRHFNHNALWSFPRSGNHWVRFISEYLSGCPTDGCKDNPRDAPIYLNTFPCREHPLAHVNPENPFTLYKSHSAYESTFTSAIVLLIRDYHAHLSYLSKYEDYKNATYPNDFIYEAITYLELIAAYDRFGGNKMVIYYEDLLAYPEREISRIKYFLDASDERHKAFMDNYDHHAELSQQGKNREWLHNDDASKHLKDYKKKLTKQDITIRKNVLQALLIAKRYQCVKPYLARYE